MVDVQGTQERLTELRRYSDSLEADARRLSSENEARVESMTSQLMTSEQEVSALKDQIRQTEKQHQETENKWKTDTDRLQVRHAVRSAIGIILSSVRLSVSLSVLLLNDTSYNKVNRKCPSEYDFTTFEFRPLQATPTLSATNYAAYCSYGIHASQ